MVTKRSKRYNYQRIPHSLRLSIIYEHVIHRVPAKAISARTGLKYNTICNILTAYENYGRTNR